jgi:hypothetical protein
LWKQIKLPCANPCHLFLLWIGMFKVFHGAYCHHDNKMGVWSISHDNFIKYIEILVSVLVCKWLILVKCDTSWEYKVDTHKGKKVWNLDLYQNQCSFKFHLVFSLEAICVFLHT